MKLTGGLDRGRKLAAPRGLQTRPTAAKVREAIFNILGPAGEDPVLDLFAGTGSLGIEALSRGAPAAVFVENNRRALTALRQNLGTMGVADRSTVIPGDVVAAINTLRDRKTRFGWVFVDPPYAAGVADTVLGALGGQLLVDGGVVIVEHDKRNLPSADVGPLVRTDQRFYGDTGLSFYRCHGSLC